MSNKRSFQEEQDDEEQQVSYSRPNKRRRVMTAEDFTIVELLPRPAPQVKSIYCSQLSNFKLSDLIFYHLGEMILNRRTYGMELNYSPLIKSLEENVDASNVHILLEITMDLILEGLLDFDVAQYIMGIVGKVSNLEIIIPPAYLVLTGDMLIELLREFVILNKTLY